MFCTHGQLTIKVIEASCASFDGSNNQHGQKTKGRGTLSSTLLPSKPVNSAYITVDITLTAPDHSVIAQSYSPPVFCCLLPSHGKGASLIGEEFIFDRVMSTSNICLTVLYEAELSETSPPRRRASQHGRGIVGVIDIPMTRLESGKSVSQWYQLLHPVSREGLKSAIRVELLFSEDADSGVLTGDKTSSLNQRRKSGTEDSIAAAMSTLMKPDTNDSSNNDENKDNTPGKSSLKSHNSELSMEAQTVESKRLPTGLVDYVVIVGQEEKIITCPATIISQAANPKLVSPRVGTSNNIAGSPRSTSYNSNVPPTMQHSRQSCVWDRFPKQDYPDNPLPDKIEWFVSPQGPETICAPTRPAHSLSSFVLSTGDNVGQLYGTRLRYYIKTGRCEQCSMKHQHLQSASSQHDVDHSHNGDECFKWWLQALDHTPAIPSHHISADNKEIDYSMYTWISVDISLLSRWSFIEQLSSCMEYLYMKILLPDTIIYESKHAGKTPASTSVSQVWTGYPSLSLNYDQIILALCFECPASVPGLYSVSMNIWGQSSSASTMNLPTPATVLSHHTSISLRQNIPSFKIDFHIAPTNGLPSCPYPLISLLEFFHPRMTIDILCCALSESRILFHSHDLSKLPIICECIVTLIYPLKWSHVYLPVVPALLLDLVEAPVPFMLGTHSAWLPYLSHDNLADVVLIDCDHGSIGYHSVAPLALPDDIDRWLMLSLKSIRYDTLASTMSRAQASLYLQLIIFDMMISLLKDVPQCLFYLDRNTPIFNRPLFLSEFTSPKSHRCVKILSDTNAFHRFTDALHTYRLEFFIECSDRFPLHDWDDQVEINPLIINTIIDSPTESNMHSTLHSSSATSLSTSIYEDSISPISESSPSFHELSFGESTNLPSVPQHLTPQANKHAAAPHRMPISFFPSIKIPSIPTMRPIVPSTPDSISSSNSSTISRAAASSAFPVAPTPLHKVFHSSFKAKNLEDLLASDEAEAAAAAAAASLSSPSHPTASISTSTDDKQPPPRVLSRRFSFGRQKSANSASFRLMNTSNKGNSDRTIDGDIDNIFSDLAPTQPSSSGVDDHQRSSEIIHDQSSSSEVQNRQDVIVDEVPMEEVDHDPCLPIWIFYGKHFYRKPSASTPSSSSSIDLHLLLQHRLDLYLPFVNRHHQPHDPVLFIDIYDPSFIDDGLTSLASITRKRSSSYFADQTPMSSSTSSTSYGSGRISVRLPKKFFHDDPRSHHHSSSMLDLHPTSSQALLSGVDAIILPSSSYDDQHSDDSSPVSLTSSRPRSITASTSHHHNSSNNNIDVVKKRLVLQRSSLVVGVGVNIAHTNTESSSSFRDDRRRTSISSSSSSSSAVSTFRDIMNNKHSPSKDASSNAIERLDSVIEVDDDAGYSHASLPSDSSADLPSYSAHSIESVYGAMLIDDPSSTGMSSSTHNTERRSTSSPVPPHHHVLPDLHLDIMRHVVNSNSSSNHHNRPFAPVIFDHHRLSEMMNTVNVWTLSDLSAATGEDIDSLAMKYSDTVEKDLCATDFSIMYKNANASSKNQPTNTSSANKAEHSSNSNAKRRRNTISNRFVGSKQSSSQLSHWLDKSPAHRLCPAAILDYLKIVFSGLDVPEFELSSIRQQCYDGLKSFDARGSLLDILKQSHSDNQPPLSGRETISSGSAHDHHNVTEYPSFFPLHSDAFLSMVELFQEILSICTQQHDYLHAYDLLIAGGLYFDIGEESPHTNPLAQESNRDTYVDFLNSSIKHHPIYQKPELWMAVLKLRLESNASTVTSPASNLHEQATAMLSSITSSPEHLHIIATMNSNRIHQIILETHAMLYMMHSLGVNPERAMLFVQNVVDKFDLDWKYFMELKLFLDRLWPSHRRKSIVIGGQNISHDDNDDDNEHDTYDDHEYEDHVSSPNHHSSHRSYGQPFGDNDDNDDHVSNANTTSDSDIKPPPAKPKKSWFRWGSSSSKT